VKEEATDTAEETSEGAAEEADIIIIIPMVLLRFVMS
jgi:hypothetical protein